MAFKKSEVVDPVGARRESASLVEPAGDPPPVASRPDAAGPGAGKRSARAKALHGAAAAGKRKPGRPSNAEVDERVDAQRLEWSQRLARRLARLPFTGAALGTGFMDFQLTKDEEAELAPDLGVALNTWVAVDPKWMAILNLSVAFSEIAAAKVAYYMIALTRLRNEEARRNEAGKDAPPAAPAVVAPEAPGAKPPDVGGYTRT